MTHSRNSHDQRAVTFGRRLWVRSGVVIACVGALLITGGKAVATWKLRAKPKPPRTVYPAKSWEARTPHELGLASASLEQLAANVQGDGFITRYGYEAFSWGNPRRKRNFGSAGKVFFSYLLCRAVEDALLPSLDEPVSTRIAELAYLNPDLGYPDRLFTWRHMATLTACYGVTEAPGTAFSYSDYQVMLLGDALTSHIYRSAWDEVFEREFVGPLQLQDKWGTIGFGEGQLPGWRPMVSVRDMNRFGLLMMRQGNWSGKQLIPLEHARMLVDSPLPGDLPNTRGMLVQMLPNQGTFGGHVHEEDHDGAFSYFWWVNHDREGEGRLWPALPPDAFAAVGYGGRCLLMVVPSQQLVVSWVTAAVQQTRHGGDGKLWVNDRMAELWAGISLTGSASSH